jgi:microcystin degradation protein MlrC
MSDRVRIAIGGIRYETNSFAGFDQDGLSLGLVGLRTGYDVVLKAPDNSEVAGARAAASGDEQLDLVGTLDIFGGCGPPVPQKYYEQLATELLDRLDALGRIDAMYLPLHCAMTTTETDDVEADLLGRVRDLLGPRTPLIVSFNLHAAVSSISAQLADGIVGYKTCPHTDYVQTGQRPMRLAAAAARREISPTVSRVPVPILTPAEAHDTSTGPLALHMTRLQKRVAELGLLDGSIFACQPWLDTSRSNWTVTVTSEVGRGYDARELADATRSEILQALQTFVVPKTRLEDIRTAVEALPAGTVLVSDSGDSPSAGATGDSVDCLRILLAASRPRVLATVTDPVAAATAAAAGKGATVTVRLGGRLTPGLQQHLTVMATVLVLADGRYERIYPAAPVDVGICAVLRVDNVDVVVTSKPAFLLDTTLFDHLGFEPSEYRVVQVKSAGGFRAFWESVSTAVVVADSLGASTSSLTALPFTKLPRDLWPFSAINPTEDR